MSTAQTFWPKGERFLTDPSRWMKWYNGGRHNGYVVKSGKSSNTNSDTTSLFVMMGRQGAYVQDVSASTWTTLCNLTGNGGILANVIAPSVQVNTYAAFRFTLDGTETTVQFPATPSYWYRAAMGAVLPRYPDTTQTTWDTNREPFAALSVGFGINIGSAMYDAGIMEVSDSSGGSEAELVHPSHALTLGFPVLRFESSLKVEVYASGLYDTTDPRDWAGCSYLLDR